MVDELCQLWLRLATTPDAPDVQLAARARRDELLEHLDDHESCRSLADAAKEPGAIFAALAADADGHVYDDERAARWAAERADEESRIESAVTNVLLPRLSEPATKGYERIVRAAGGALRPLDLFRATDSVALSIRGYPPRGQKPTLAMSDDGSLLADGKLAIPARALAAEISRSTSLPSEVAAATVAWVPDALDSCNRLLLGLEATLSTGVRTLVITPRDNAVELAALWAPLGSATGIFEEEQVPVQPVYVAELFSARSVEDAVTEMLANARQMKVSSVPLGKVTTFKAEQVTWSKVASSVIKFNEIALHEIPLAKVPPFAKQYKITFDKIRASRNPAMQTDALASDIALDVAALLKIID